MIRLMSGLNSKTANETANQSTNILSKGILIISIFVLVIIGLKVSVTKSAIH